MDAEGEGGRRQWRRKGRMDVNEIEKLYKDAASVTWFRNAIGHLLSCLTEYRTKLEKAEAKIKGLENELSNIDEW